MNNRQLNEVKNFIDLGDFSSMITFICQNSISCDDFIENKLYLKIVKSSFCNTVEKTAVRHELSQIYTSDYFDNYLSFVEEFVCITQKLADSICNKLLSLTDTLSEFYSILNRYYLTNRTDNLPVYAIKLLCEFAHTTYKNTSKITRKLRMNNQLLLKQIINECIKYGSISELFDDVSYQKHYVSFINRERKPCKIELKLKDKISERRDAIFSQYEIEAARYRLENDSEGFQPFFDYYKCHLCKKLGCFRLDELSTDILIELVRRQCAFMSTIESFFFLQSTLSTTVLSIYFLIYCELIVMVFASCSQQVSLDVDYIKKNMLFNEVVSTEAFDQALELLQKSDFTSKGNNLHSYPTYYFQGNSFVLYRWMFDENILIANEVMDICIGDSNNKRFGEYANAFGKQFFEALVRFLFERAQWMVNKNDIKIKDVTDIDLFAFKDGVLVIGQIKLGHENYSRHNQWKIEKTTKMGIVQAQKVKEYFDKHPDKLVALLNKLSISEDLEIKSIIYLVVTSSSSLSGYSDANNEIYTIGCNVLDHILLSYKDDIDGFQYCCKHPVETFKPFDVALVTSKINCDEFTVTFEEIEANEVSQ
jgi:hypothetical protein